MSVKWCAKYRDAAYSTLWIAGTDVYGELCVELGTGKVITVIPLEREAIIVIILSFTQQTFTEFL